MGVANPVEKHLRTATGPPWDDVVLLSHSVGNTGVSPPVGTSRAFAQSYRT
ncbi:hypothetical protein [Corynebacterium efficiens YS-314]|uniref:Uncharacterized protein n=1 Tax=Corynebacterium efficiens (strain DSM 44549 / YS-314 / AJ 12310 / JCM 11189 / NBRC 100395) TaxID=196164 RepID=Q8FRQ6_COREF|nr:hypothetical protein [Corynebacterium efficiens YS-314]